MRSKASESSGRTVSQKHSAALRLRMPLGANTYGTNVSLAFTNVNCSRSPYHCSYTERAHTDPDHAMVSSWYTAAHSPFA